MLKHKMLGVGIVAVLALGGAACGSSGNDAGDASEAVQKYATGDKATAKKKDSIFQNDDPDSSDVDIDDATGAELPADWPDGLDFPEGAELVIGQSLGGGAPTHVSAVLDDGDAKEVASFFTKELKDLGYEVGEEVVNDRVSEYSTQFSATNADHQVAVTASNTGQGTAKMSVTVTPNS